MNSSQTSFYTSEELKGIGFASLGENVLISRYARFYGASKILIGNNVRIDDFCLLSGDITLGNFIHISAYCALYGGLGIEMHDFTGLSPRTTIFSANDDFSGNFLMSPLVYKEFTNVSGGKVTIEKFSQIGSGSIVLPDLNIEEGVAVGAFSLVNKSLPRWGIYAGIPAKFIKVRRKGLLRLEKQFKTFLKDSNI